MEVLILLVEWFYKQSYPAVIILHCLQAQLETHLPSSRARNDAPFLWRHTNCIITHTSDILQTRQKYWKNYRRSRKFIKHMNVNAYKVATKIMCLATSIAIRQLAAQLGNVDNRQCIAHKTVGQYIFSITSSIFTMQCHIMLCAL